MRMRACACTEGAGYQTIYKREDVPDFSLRLHATQPYGKYMVHCGGCVVRRANLQSHYRPFSVDDANWKQEVDNNIGALPKYTYLGVDWWMGEHEF